MKKRVFALCLTLSLLLGLLPTAALAAEHEVTEVPIWEETPQFLPEEEDVPAELTATEEWLTVPGIEGGQICFDSSTGTITDCETSVTVANIPAQINGVAVTSIGIGAFGGCTDLTSVTIPDSVTSIGGKAFRDCTSLTSITIPDSVTNIGDEAFQRCTSLTSVTIPNSVTNMGSFHYNVFGSCPGLKTAGPIGGNYNIQYGWTDVIPSRAFSGCTSLTSVIISEDVTSIGFHALSDCRNLTSVIIPQGVTSIGSYAFSGCSNLTSVIIPHSVTSIGTQGFESDAFRGCTRLKTAGPIGGNYNIQFGWTETIPKDAFCGCTSLTSVIIPNSVTTIGDKAFAYCTRLTSVTIPKSVTSTGFNVFYGCSSLRTAGPIGSGCDYEFGWTEAIPVSAFSGCSGLTSVTIPTDVTSIETFAFSDCTSLTSVVIPVSVTSIGWSAFSNYTSLTDVYYSGDETQWSKIEIEDYNDSLMSATIHYNSTGPTSLKHTVPKGKYMLHVVDEKGKNLRGTTVTWNGESQETDSKGLATFDLLTVGEPAVTVSKDGYLTWSNANSNWTKSPDRYETVILYPEALGAYKLASCRYSNSSLMTSAKDLLTKTKTVSLGNEISSAGDLDDGKFYLSCGANDSSNVDHYELWQKGKEIATEIYGFFTLSIDDFQDGGGCFVRIVSKDGDKVDTRINLQFKTAKLNKASSISWGGKSVNFKVDDNVPFLGGSTFTANLPIQLPITFLAGDDKLQIGLNVNVTGGKTEKEQLDKLRESIQRTKTARGLFASRQWEECKALIKEKNGFKFSRDGELNAIGYLEANWGSSTATGEIMIQYTIAPVEYGYTTLMPVPVIVAVPVTAKIKFSAEGAVVGAVSYNWNDATFLGTLDLDFKAALKAVGAIGTSDIGVGPYGSATLTGGYRLEGPTTGWKDIDLTGELGLTAYIFSSEIKKAFAYNTWHIYSSNTVKAASLMAADEHWQAGLFSAEDYHSQDLSYLAKESGWLGGTGDQAQLFAASGASTTLTPLLTDTYRNARPTMAAGPDGLYAVFLRADAASGDIYAVVTKYDGSTWGTPIRVDSGAVLDSTPILCADGSGTFWLAYARTAADVNKDSLSDFAQNQSIVVGTVDRDTLTFTQKAEFPGVGYAHMPQLAVIGGVPTLAWVDSPVTGDDSVLWPASATVYTSTWDGTTWSAAVAAETVDKPVTQLILGEKDGQRALAYVADEDGDATTQEDRGLYVNGTLIAQGVLGTVTLAQASGMSGADYMWNTDGCLMAADGTQISASGISNEYAVTGSRIYYSAAGAEEQGGAHLTTVLYDDGAWSEAVTLTGGERYLEDLSVVTWNGKDYLMGMNTLAEITEADVIDAKNLVWAEVMPSSDLRLDGLDYPAEGLAAGENVTVTITVTNVGDHSVNSIDMVLGDDHWTENCQLAPGQSMEITRQVAYPAALTDYAVSVAESGWEDFTPEDNSATLALGYAQLDVELKEQRIGTSQALVAIVTNTGIDSDSGILRFTNEAGEVLDEVELSTLAAGDSEIVTYPAQLPNGDYTATLLCGEKSLYADDTDTIHVERYCEIISTQVADNTLTASVIGEAGATVYCAFYDVDGRMLQVVSEPLEAGAAEMSFPAPASADHGKVFLLSSQQFPLCPAVQISKDITTK